MTQNNYDSERTLLDPTSDDRFCPKCGAAMESIESKVEGLPLEHLQLCPSCYLVMWRDQAGFQIRQGVPMKDTGAMKEAGDPEGC